jgi:hypothetical protein
MTAPNGPEQRLLAESVRVFIVWDADGKGFYLHSIWATHDTAYEESSKLPGSWVDDAYTIQGTHIDGQMQPDGGAS